MTPLRDWCRKRKLSDEIVFWFLLLALTPLLTITLLTYRYSVDLLQTEVTKSLLAIAQRHVRQLEKYGEERQNDITTLAYTPIVARVLTGGGIGGTSEDQALRLFLHSYSEIGAYDDCFLISREGDVIFADRRLEMVGTNVREEIYRNSEFQKVFERALTLLSNEFSDLEHFPETGNTAAFVAAPVFQNGELAGVIVLRLGARDIYRVVNDYTGLGDTGETMVMRNLENQILFVAPLRHDPDAAFRRIVQLGDPLAIPARKAIVGERGSGMSIDYRGADILAAWSYLPLFRWGIVVKIDNDEAFEPVQALRNLCILITLGTAIVVVFVGARIAHSISRPIEIIAGTARQVETGEQPDPGAMQSVSRRSDEIGSLARVFSDMTVQVFNREENLETLVSERTQELQTSNQHLRLAQEAINQDLEMAKAVQAALVREGIVNMGAFSAYARMTPAQRVGGDFVDVSELSNGMMFLAIGDVSGKGLAAALFMAASQSAVKSTIVDCSEISVIAEETNRRLCSQNPMGLFVTCVLAIVNLKNGAVDYVCAGHEPAFVIGCDDSRWPVPMTGGLAMGLMEDADYSSGREFLQPGETLFLYTDGLTDATNLDGELFGKERLEGTLDGSAGRLPEDIVNHVWAELGSFSAGTKAADDMTCLVLHRRCAAHV